MISILILTKNEEMDLPGCLDSVAWSDDVHVLDSASTDRTIEIAQRAGAKVTVRKFDNWASHQNWAVQNIPFKYPWVFYLDADERVSDSLRESIRRDILPESSASAFRIQRRDFFADGTWLKYAQLTPFYIRLFRPQRIRYERLVNPVTIIDGKTEDLRGYLDHYPFSKGIAFWLQRHIQYADFEARTVIENRTKSAPFVRALFSSNFEERRRNQKRLFYSLPFRPFIRFFYMLLWRHAFLDGRAGLTYAALQCIYEYLIVLRTRELSNSYSRRKNAPQTLDRREKPGSVCHRNTPVPQSSNL